MRPRNNVPDYEWQGLPENNEASFWIRILELQPGLFCDPIVCTLDLGSIENGTATPEYEAISYCWGEPTPTTTIFINGKRATVRENLRSALTYLRYSDRPRWLWTDALCINQGDLDEKASQVSEMSQIYACANYVISWLGPGLDGTAAAFPLLQSVASKHDYMEERKAHLGVYWRYALDMTPKDFQDVLVFFCNPYFERLWVVQEVAKAKSAVFQCGFEEMSWEDLAVAMLVFSKVYLPSGFPIHPNVATARLICDLLISDVAPRKLSSLLEDYSIRIAQHPADKIFALIGLLHPDVRSLMPELSPNYRMDVRELYIHAAVRCMIQDGSLDVLSTCQPKNHSIPNLPSWAPDWSFNFRDPSPTETVPKVNILRPNSNFKASGNSLGNGRRKGSALILEGYVFDELRVVGEPYTITQCRQFSHANTRLQVFLGPSPYKEIWSALRERAVQSRIEARWRFMFDTYRKKTPQAQGLSEEAYCLTITALDSQRLWQSRRLVADEPHVMRTYNRYRLLTTPMRIGVRLGVGLTLLTILEFLTGALLHVLRTWGFWQMTSMDLPLHTQGRAMGWTTKGMFANLPEDVQAGDVLCLVAGAKVPLILRPRGPEIFELVGDAYVYGIMLGEIWDDSRCRDITLV